MILENEKPQIAKIICERQPFMDVMTRVIMGFFRIETVTFKSVKQSIEDSLARRTWVD